MKNPSEMSYEELKNEIVLLRDKEDEESKARVAHLRRELNSRFSSGEIEAESYAVEEEEDEGSFFGGFVLGFVLSIIGLALALAFGKRNVKKGSILGFIIELIASAIVGIIVLVRQGL